MLEYRRKNPTVYIEKNGYVRIRHKRIHRKIENMAEKAFETDRQIKELRRNVDKVVRLSTFELGRLLKEMRDGELYRELGYDAFTAYLGDPEISFSQSSAYGAIQIYETYELKLKLSQEQLEDIPVRRLNALAGIVDEESIGKWLERARSLSESDFRTELVEYRENKDQPQFIPAPRLQRCGVCGKWKVIADDKTLCQC
jgi:hypothetical protein